MKSIPLTQYSNDTLTTLLSGIPYFKDMMFNDPDLMDLLAKFSSIYEPAAGDTVIEKGARDNIFYFLLSGQLIVFPDGKKSKKAVNFLSAGQPLGLLALLTGQPRNATLVVDPKGGRCQLIGTDFEPFGALTDYSKVHLGAKLALWRMVANNTRWKLNVYKMQNPEHRLAGELAAIETFKGEKDSEEELLSLDRQVRALTELMSRWNEALAKG